MATVALIIGESGTGKSRSIINLPPQSTAVINVIGKALPFAGWKAKFTQLDSAGGTGNMYRSDESEKIIAAIKYIDEKRKDVKVLVIDDFQYVLANEFMRRSSEKTYQKFTDIANHAWEVIWQLTLCREDLVCFVLSHSDTDGEGKTKMKTIGKMLDEKITPEGMFTVVMNTAVEHTDDKNVYWFETQNNGHSTSKSPEGMFDTFRIPNDLKMVYDAIKKYEGGEVVSAPTAAKVEIKKVA